MSLHYPVALFVIGAVSRLPMTLDDDDDDYDGDDDDDDDDHDHDHDDDGGDAGAAGDGDDEARGRREWRLMEKKWNRRNECPIVSITGHMGISLFLHLYGTFTAKFLLRCKGPSDCGMTFRISTEAL